MDDPDVQFMRYESVVEARMMDLARIDLRQLTEDRVRQEITAYCERHDLQMAGPVMLDWTCRGAVRVRPRT